jgi:hypothetical protein
MFFKKNNSSRSDAGDRDADFTGKWISTFGPLEITRNGDGIRGEYRFGTVRGEIVGAVAGSRLSFRYREPSVAGEGWFDLVRPCRFAGKWRPDGSDRWFDWNGERLYEGIWNSSFGPLRLVHNGDGTVCGFYELGGPSDIKGSIDGNRLSFSYREPQAGGEGILSAQRRPDELFRRMETGRPVIMAAVARPAHDADARNHLACGPGIALAALSYGKGIFVRRNA